jgi:uncharacterized protein YjbI with pentapeptide repeats
LFNDDVSFARSLFQASAVFIDAAFRGRAVFDGADMRRASFKGTDLRGVDLSEAITDSTTKFPNRLQP